MMPLFGEVLRTPALLIEACCQMPECIRHQEGIQPLLAEKRFHVLAIITVAPKVYILSLSYSTH